MGLKAIIRRILYKIYKVGLNQDEKIRSLYFIENWKSNSIFNPKTVRIDNTATISNNRLDKSKIIIGDSSWIKGHLMLFAHGGEIEIGENCHIGEGSKIWSAKKIKIGNNVLIAHNVNIHDNISHPLDLIERQKDYLHIYNIGLRKENNLNEEEIYIEDDVWIGFNSTILKGVKIGRGAIIGACTVITKDVEPFEVIVEAHQIRKINKTRP